MKKLDLSKAVKNAKLTVAKKSPEILVGIGIAGMVTTVVLAVKATPKAIVLMEQKKEELKEDKLSPVEVVKAAWKCYIPAAVIGCASITCVIGASTVHARRNAALATAYSLSQSALREYRGKVIETFGEKKEQTVRDAVAKEKISQNPIVNKEIFLTKRGDTLCYDSLSGRYFKSDADMLRKAENTLNRLLINDVYVSLNEFYYEIGLPPTKIGDDLGWNLYDGGCGMIELYFSSHLTADDTPCLVIDYNIAPKYDYAHNL